LCCLESATGSRPAFSLDGFKLNEGTVRRLSEHEFGKVQTATSGTPMAALVVHAWKNSESQRTLYINPVVAVARARGLSAAGWHVHVVDANGCIFYPEKFDHLLKFDPGPATKF
jgi:hypothetical protein